MSVNLENGRDAYRLEIDQGQLTLRALGYWDLHTASLIDEALKADLKKLGYGAADEDQISDNFEHVVFDFSGLTRIDTAGAYVLTRAIGCHDGFCRRWSVIHYTQGQKVLIDAAAMAAKGVAVLPPKPWYDPIERLGKGAVRGFKEVIDTLSFFGQFVLVITNMLLQPQRIRWKSVVALIESVGLDAVPIVASLSFFIGAVIAFMGADLLASFGAKIFVVDLVGVSVLREFAVLITAILLAGRSNSAFTAEIGSMKMRQEIDAMTVIGLSREETLVAPRALACLISAPILTLIAMLTGLLGGLLVAWSQGISPVLFTARITEVISINHFWVGMVKAPVFALVIAIIGCRQGLAVEGSVESLGRRTTVSVVQAIFSVIVIDAMFAMLFLKLGV
jgi:phospholipid/cholesterol/gamma-HCH transport system permease protein